MSQRNWTVIDTSYLSEDYIYIMIAMRHLKSSKVKTLLDTYVYTATGQLPGIYYLL